VAPNARTIITTTRLSKLLSITKHVHMWTGRTAIKKECTACRESKEINEFSLDRSRPDGKAVWCRRCRGIHYAEYRPANKEKSNKRQKEYRSANKEKLKERQREYLSATKET